MISTVLPTGTTIRMLLAGCACAEERLRTRAVVAPLVEEAVRACEMTALASAGHDFPGAGFSLCVILAESHVAIHTYPEAGRSAVVELTVCDYRRPNRARARRLASALRELFAATHAEVEELGMTPA